VHLRRALLLFAIVLALAAVAASVSRPGEESREPPPRTLQPPAEPEVAPGPAAHSGPPATIVLSTEANERRRLDAGRAATLEVAVEEAGMVEIPRLGLSAAGEPVTPARFDVLVRQPGRYPAVFVPADGDEPEAAGTLVVVEPER
jgi:hypothetical protein